MHTPLVRLASTLAVSLTVSLTAALLVGCGGTGSGTQAPAPDSGPKLPTGVTMAMITQGDSIFNTASCQRCHGKGGIGAQNGPALAAGNWQHGSGSFDDIVKTISSGVTKEEMKDQTRRFPMRARGGVQPLLTDEQVKAVAAYVWSISHKS